MNDLIRNPVCPYDIKWFHVFTEFLRVFTHAAGSEMRMLEGCYCHRAMKVEEPSYKKRRKQMLELTDSEACGWSGKGAPLLAMGEGRNMSERVRSSSSNRYKQALLEAPAEAAAKVTAMADRILSRWCIIIMGKTEYHTRIPHAVTCIFAQYLWHRACTLSNSVANRVKV